MATILAIESSCDDTAAAIISNGRILSNVLSSQDVHKDYGGVIPELASRKHHENIVPVVDQALALAKTETSKLDAIAFTKGPGLLGSLLVGSSFAKSMAFSLDIPLISVNHMKAHVMAHFIDDPKPTYPFLCLTVSGGHTQILIVEKPNTMTVLGSTLDDAAGEAFDKIGKYLGLEYPAGPIIDKYSKKGRAIFNFPKPKISGLDFSFSGLKTAVLYFLQKELKTDKNFIADNLYDICCSVQSTIVEILIDKLKVASSEYKIDEIAIAGGVSANSHLRIELNHTAEQRGWKTHIPSIQYCTDNAAMIAMSAHYKYLEKDFSTLDTKAEPRLSILDH